MMKTIKCVGLGEILWDMLPDGKQLGGAPTNFAYHVKALSDGDVEAFTMSSIGDDALGEEIRAKLPALGISQDHLTTNPDRITGTVDVTLSGNGIPTYDIKEGVAWDYISITNPAFAQEVDVVCFGSLAQRHDASRIAIQGFLSQTRPDCMRIFDINLRQHYYTREIIDQSLHLATVLKINDEELPIVAALFGFEGDVDTQLRAILTRYALDYAILTEGAGGSILVTKDAIYKHAGYPATVQDTVGAGDSFTATIALGLLHDMHPEEINDIANQVASFVCASAGATPQLPQKLIAKFVQYDAPALKHKTAGRTV